MPRGGSRPDLLRAAALRLFTERGVAATSLQDIATELGVTKAAVYHHYRLKDDIVLAVLAPALESLATIITSGKAIGDRTERTRWLIDALADQAVQHRTLYSVMLRDATAIGLISTNRAPAVDFVTLRDLLATEDQGQRVRVGVFLSGLVAPASDPDLASISDVELRHAIAESGRRLLLDEPDGAISS